MKNVVLVFLFILLNWNLIIVNKFVNMDYYIVNINILIVVYYRNFLEIGCLLMKIVLVFILVWMGFVCFIKVYILLWYMVILV